MEANTGDGEAVAGRHVPPGATGAAPARYVAPHVGDRIWFTTNLMTVKATAETTGGAYGLVEAVVPAGSGPALHVHRREDESFWILDGTLTVRCGDETFTAGPGSYVFLPRDVPHTFIAEGDVPVRLLSMATPGGFERYFAAVGRPAESDGLPPAGPPDLERVARIGEEFGVEIVGPPLPPRELA